jgi:hypothetical protein
MTKYRLDVYDTSGDKQFVITDFRKLSYVKRVNAPGIVQFDMAGDHSLLDDIAANWQIEVWRKPSDGTWGREMTGLYRYLNWNYQYDNNAEIICPGLMSMLGWRIVAWTAAYADRSKFTSEKAETVANTIVKYNCTSSATTGNGRERDGAITGMTVEADGAAGNTVDWYCAWDNVLSSLQDLVKIGGGDFDLVKTSSTAWQFRWYEGQLGTDNSSSVTFALERGNMANPIYVDNRLNEKTAAIVGGQGEESDRAIEIRTGTDYNASTNNIETFVAATDITTTAGLNSRGDKALAEGEAVKTFNFDVLQVPGCLYGDDYVLGDKVTAVNPYDQTTYTVKIQAVMVSFKDDGTEDIKIEMSEPL